MIVWSFVVVVAINSHDVRYGKRVDTIYIFHCIVVFQIENVVSGYKITAIIMLLSLCVVTIAGSLFFTVVSYALTWSIMLGQ